MELGEKLPVGVVETDRLVDDVYQKRNSRLVGAALALAFGAQALTGTLGMWEHAGTEPKATESAPAVAEPFGVDETTTTLAPMPDSILVPLAQTSAASESIFSFLPARAKTPTIILPPPPLETTTTTTTTMLPPPETTTTLLSSPPTTKVVISIEQCWEIMGKMSSEFPLLEGWSYKCMPKDAKNDGMTFADSKVIEFYPGDPGDSAKYFEYVYLHEETHTEQLKYGFWTSETRPGYWVSDLSSPTGHCQSIPKKPATRAEKRALLVFQTINPPFYCEEDLERQADDRAYDLGRREGNDRGTRAGAIAACQAFEARGANIC